MCEKSLTKRVENLDYKAPLSWKNDYRTTYHTGHRLLVGPPRLNQPQIRKDPNEILKLKTAKFPYNSESRDAYGPKYVDRTKDVNPLPFCGDTNYVKPFVDNKLNSCSRPLSTFDTWYRQEFDLKQPTDDGYQPIKRCPPKVKPSSDNIDPAVPGVSKYLDMMATTNMLTFVPHSVGSEKAGKDIVTVWDWLGIAKCNKNIPVTKVESKLQDYKPLVEYPKRVFQKRIPCVPHNGITTEIRQNYVLPKEKIELCFEDTMPAVVTSQMHPLKLSTEADLYGSGKRIQKYVDVGGLKHKQYTTKDSETSQNKN